jgi:hypothetical protein
VDFNEDDVPIAETFPDAHLLDSCTLVRKYHELPCHQPDAFPLAQARQVKILGRDKTFFLG